MLLSRLFLRSRYRPLHLTGVLLCIAGLCLTVLSDKIVPTSKEGVDEDESASYPHALLGDVLCLIGAVRGVKRGRDGHAFVGWCGRSGMSSRLEQYHAFPLSSQSNRRYTAPPT